MGVGERREYLGQGEKIWGQVEGVWAWRNMGRRYREVEQSKVKGRKYLPLKT